MTKEELMNKVNVNQFSDSTRRLLMDIITDMSGLLDRWPGLEDETTTIVDGLTNLGTLQDTPGTPSPEDLFEIMGFGHFKECYYFSPSFVIKFCAERNPTTDEEKALGDAFANGFDDLFLPTKYYELPHPLTSENLERDDDDEEVYDEEAGTWIDNPEWHDNTILTHVSIQPKVTLASHKYAELDNAYNKSADAECLTSKTGWEVTRISLGLPFNADRYDYLGLNGVCLVWALDFVRVYGVARLKLFAKFCEEYHIWDLHSENVGYTLPGADGTAYPVILDWMSR